jgi:hypothetical protein
MIFDYLQWLQSFLLLDTLYYSMLAGVLFGFYVFYKGDAESSWRDIVGWGVAVWLTFIGISNLHRFVDGDPNFWISLHTTTIRWFLFIFTIVATAGILRKFGSRFKDKCFGCLP